jgi:hypothetical protein
MHFYYFPSPKAKLTSFYHNQTIKIKFSVRSTYLVFIRIYEHHKLIFRDPSLYLEKIDVDKCIYFVRTIFKRVKLYHQAYHFRQSISDYDKILTKLKLNVRIPTKVSSQLNYYMQDIFIDFQNISNAFQLNLEVNICAENILKKLQNLFLALSIFNAVFYDEQYFRLCFCPTHFQGAMHNTLIREGAELHRLYH